MNKLFADTEERIKAVLSERDKRAEGFARNLAAEKEAISAAEKAMEAAFAAADKDTYTAAKGDRTRAEIGAEMCQRKLAEIMQAPLITADEYTETVHALLAAIRAEDEAARAKLSKLAEQMRQIGDELEATINRGNALLHQLQYDLYKDRAEIHTDTGAAVHVDSLDKKYRDIGTVIWSRAAATHYQAKRG